MVELDVLAAVYVHVPRSAVVAVVVHEAATLVVTVIGPDVVSAPAANGVARTAVNASVAMAVGVRRVRSMEIPFN